MSEQNEQQTAKEPKSTKKKARDYNPDAYKMISRKTKDGVQYITEALSLPPGNAGGVIQRDTVIQDDVITVTTVHLRNVRLKRRANNTWCYYGGN